MTTARDIPMRNIPGGSIPALGLGTYELKGATCERAVDDALELGYRHLDTARAYGNESDIGRAVAASRVAREELFLTTKIWSDQLDATALKSEVHRSLEALRTEYLDLVLIHWPSEQVPLRETARALYELESEGVIRNFGVSNFTPRWVLEMLDLVPIFCNQIECHPLLRQEVMRTLARHHGFLITAYSPLGQGLVGREPVLREIGQQYGKSPYQVALRWLLDLPELVAIPRSSRREHLAANLDIFDFRLSEDDRAAIEGLPDDQRQVDPDFAPNWTEGEEQVFQS